MDPFSFASEIAWHCVESKRNLASLDEIFCDPQAAAEFDRIAARYAPGYSPFDYRWAAFWIRKRAIEFRKNAMQFSKSFVDARLPRMKTWSSLDVGEFADEHGVYVVRAEKQKLYVGETFNLKSRLDFDAQAIPFEDAVGVSIIKKPGASASELHAIRSVLVSRYRPELNYKHLGDV